MSFCKCTAEKECDFHKRGGYTTSEDNNMSMFDYVIYEAPCYSCGVTLKEFQSKDGPCLLSQLQPKEVRGFYTNCNNCGAWNEFKVIASCITIERVRQDDEQIFTEDDEISQR
jgi:hypothetical protein